MKNLFFVSVAFSIFSGTSLTATAQQSFNFIDQADPAIESGEHFFAISTPAKDPASTPLLITLENRMPVETEMCTPLQFKYALLLNREVENITNQPLYNFIDEWYGTGYRYGGSTKKGVDCSSLTSKLMKEVYCIDLPRTAREQFKASEKINREELAEGDLVFFNTRGGVSHVGVFLGDGYFVHASASSGVMISHMDEAYFKKRYIGAGRIQPEPEISDIDFSRALL